WEERLIFHDEGGDGCADRSRHARDRRDSDRQKQEEPHGGVDSSRNGEKDKEDTEQGGHPFAAAKPEPDRVEVPHESTRGRGRSGLLAKQFPGNQDGGSRLEAIEDERQRRKA